MTRLAAVMLACAVSIGVRAETARIDSPAAAVEAAKRYTKARCNTRTPCTYRPERDGNQWRVWVQLTRRNAPNASPQPYPGGKLVLYFDDKGTLLRRLEAD